MKTFEEFTGLYPLSKTLRFELKPMGRTLEWIQRNGILEEDQHRAESYVEVKKIIDEYHKAFINLALHDFKLIERSMGGKNSLEEYLEYYSNGQKDEKATSVFKDIQSNLRKQIAKRLTGHEAYKRIFKKELIQEDLIEFVRGKADSDYKLSLIEEFRNFTTYFKNFHTNRANMYSDEEQSTAIAYRLINENLPKFVDNIQTFKKIYVTAVKEKLPFIYSDFEEYLNVEHIEDMFELDYFNDVLTQTQIDVYNAIIGGKTLDNGKKIQGLNEYINLYNQQNKDARLPKLKPLFKQILSDRNAISWLPEEFKTDNQTLKSIKESYDALSGQVLAEGYLKQLLESLADYDLSGIYIRNDLQLTDISQKMFGSWSVIPNAIKANIGATLPIKKKESHEQHQERIAKAFKSHESFSISYIDKCLETFDETKRLEKYFATLGAVNNDNEQRANLFACIANAYADVRTLLTNDYPEQKNLAQDKDNVEKIKNLLDTIKELQHFIKPLLGNGDEADKDERFYGEFSALWNELDQITPLYNMVRNYMTRKPYSTEKIKVNFQNSTLMDGWDLNKERDNTTVILRKDGLYYVAIMNKRYNKAFSTYPSGGVGESYEKMEYKLLPGANKMLPKVFFSTSRIAEFNPSKEIIDNYEKGTHKKGTDFNLQHCHTLIDFFKTSIEKHEDWSKFGFSFSDTSSYEDLSGFYREVEQQGYKISFKNVSVDYIDTLVEEGKLYLFQIYNKDFSPYSKGTPNMHTLYWKMLFDEKNLADVVYKLNGKAEVFFRKASISYQRPTHPANQPIKNKNRDNNKSESTFTYDLIKDRRYTVDKFEFHVPITMNFKSVGQENINLRVNEFLQSHEDVHVIGIDRGERHLLYLVVIDKFGNIKEQFSLNEIVNEYAGNKYSTNYHDLLQKREEERKEARQSWKSIENIKELKEGYLSQVIHKITELMMKYNAIVVLEDLNFGFMRGRQKVEKQVYQKFEKMLIDKLNFLVDKKKDVEEIGGVLKAYQLTSKFENKDKTTKHKKVLKAYQLTSKFESFQKLGKQSGFLFYIPAWNTSKIDPVTGFVNLLDTRYESIDKAKSFFCKFDFIRYNTTKDYFEFKLDYDKYGKQAEGTRTLWTLCTYGTRIETFRNADKNSNWDSKEIYLTQQFKELFAQYNIDINDNLKEAICDQTEKAFFERLLHLLKLTLQMRNSVTGTDIDYLVSPVADEQGNFYDSRTCDENLPANADANGAYNIARKGLWAIRQIRKAEDLKKVQLAITNKEWLRFAQEKPYLND